MLLGLKPENVRVIFRRGSGCYGLQRRRHGDLRRRAAVAGRGQAGARAAYRARTKWPGEKITDSRSSWTSAPGLDAEGNIVAWDHESVVAGARAIARAMTTPGNVITGMLAGFEPDAFAAAIAGA